MKKLCVIPGDGIGLEVIPAAVQVLERVVQDLEIFQAEAGWDCFQKHGVSVPTETLSLIRECGAALFGAVSSPSKQVKGYRSAVLTMRQSLDLYANIRPVVGLPGTLHHADIDLIIVRENTEGLYSGLETLEEGRATATRVITRKASLRIAEQAIAIAKEMNRKKITIVHKANVLPITDGLFRDSVQEVIKNHASAGFNVDTDEMLVDLAALKIISEPQIFDVIVTTNLFGDILSDAAAHWCGGLGIAPSINLGDKLAIAEPVHGSAPDIAGKGIANPIASILSAALLMRFTWQQSGYAERIEQAVHQTVMEFTDNGKIIFPRNLKTQIVLDSILKNL